MTYNVVFCGQKLTIVADYVDYIGTKAWFHLGKKLVAYFDIPFGTPFCYYIRQPRKETK